MSADSSRLMGPSQEVKEAVDGTFVPLGPAQDLCKIQGMEEAHLYTATHSPRTILLNAMRYLATSADFEWPEVYARSIYTLADALVEVSMAVSGPAELQRRSLRVRVCIPALLLWEEKQQEHTLMVTVSGFGCAVQSRRFLEPGTTVRLECDGKIIQGRVVYSLKDPSTRLVEVGIGFDQDGGEFWWREGSLAGLIGSAPESNS